MLPGFPGFILGVNELGAGEEGTNVMTTLITRRAVIQTAPLLALAISPATAGPRTSAGAPEFSLPRLDPALARAVVGESHRSLEKVQELIGLHPEAAKAAVDSGFGDWESALGAASHTGRREIALLLIEHGARPDIFAFAMLGHTAAVRAMIDAAPGIQRILGPHGIPLARHARAGGDDARETCDYLVSLGDADTGHPSTPTTPDARAACSGDYVCTDGQNFTITDEKNALQFKVEGWFPRGLLHQGDLTFHPVGAPSVRMRFTLQDAKAAGVTIRDGELIAEATRV